MGKALLVFLLFCLASFLPGCATGRHGFASYNKNQENASFSSQGNSVEAAQRVPAGMRLGTPYISALGENCYEIIGELTPSSPAQALCLRQQGWELLPPIYMHIPTTGIQTASQL